jgi:phytanoyl-CoA hydroxylase
VTVATTLLADGALALDVDSAIAAYREHGYARLSPGRSVVSPEGLADLRGRADDIMLGRVVHEGLFFQHDSETGHYDDLRLGEGYRGPSLEYRKIEKLERDPIFRAWIENPLFERIARAVIADDVVLYRAVLFTKGARGGTVLPFHQDGGEFWGLDRDPVLQLWTALDDAPEEAGCVEVVPDSHRTGLATRNGGVVPDNHVAAADVEARVVPLPAVAGEVLLIHNHVWHRSARNSTGKTRRALNICYMSAATRCRRKKRAPRVFVPVFAKRPDAP